MSSEKRKGFTITEILLVISIISVLVYFAMAEFSGNKGQFEKRKIESDLANIKKAMSVFAIRNDGSFPSSLRELKDAGLFRVIPKDPYGYEYEISVRGSDVYVGTYRNGTVEIKIGAQ